MSLLGFLFRKTEIRDQKGKPLMGRVKEWVFIGATCPSNLKGVCVFNIAFNYLINIVDNRRNA